MALCLCSERKERAEKPPKLTTLPLTTVPPFELGLSSADFGSCAVLTCCSSLILLGFEMFPATEASVLFLTCLFRLFLFGVFEFGGIFNSPCQKNISCPSLSVVNLTVLLSATKLSSLRVFKSV